MKIVQDVAFLLIKVSKTGQAHMLLKEKSSFEDKVALIGKFDPIFKDRGI